MVIAGGLYAINDFGKAVLRLDRIGCLQQPRKAIAVDASSVTLNEIEINSCKADNCGNFVAKFLMSAVKDLVEEGHLELGIIMLTLDGLTTNNEEFSGSQEITVISIEPAGAGGK